MDITAERRRTTAPGPMPRGSWLKRGPFRLLSAMPVLVASLVLVVLVVLPMGALLFATFVDSPPGQGASLGDLTTENYTAVLQGEHRALFNTVVIGLGGTGVALVMGGGLAWLTTRTNVPLPRFLRLVGIMPLFFSSLVGAIAWSLIGSPSQGFANIALRSAGLPDFVNIYSIPGIIFVFGLYYAPYTFLFVAAAFSLMNPELEEAARVHGASSRRVLSRITLRLAAPAILGAATLTMALIMENFPIPSVLGNPSHIETLPLRIFRLMSLTPGQPNEAAANGVLLLIVLVVMLSVQRRIMAGRQFTTVTGKGFRPRRQDLGRWRWLGLALGLIYFFASMVLPVIALFISASRPNPFVSGFSDLVDWSQYTTDIWNEVLHMDDFHTGIQNSLIVSTGAAIVGTALCFGISYIVNRTNSRGRGHLSYLAMWPAAVPALVMGLGFLWTWIRFPLIYGTLFILIAAFVAHFLPQAYQGVSSSMIQVHGDLEESAQVAGASRLTTIRRVLLPLVRPGVVSTLLLVFVLCIREFSVAIFLFTTDTQVVSITIYQQWDGGSFPPVAAMSLLYMLMLFVIAAACGRWLKVGGDRPD